MPIRQYDFATGIQSSAAPTIATPTLGDDLTTKTYVDGLNTAMDLDKAERQYWGDAVADNAALKAVVPGERFDRQTRLSEGGTALYRYDSASTGIDDGDLILSPNDAPVSGRWLKLTVTGGGGSGSGSGAGSNLLQALMSDESDSAVAVNPNVISDDFGDEEKGTKVNVIQSSSALVLPNGQTTGSYTRTTASSVDLANVDAIMVATLRAGAPNATAWAPSPTDTAPSIVFTGDLTGIFAATRKFGVYKQDTIDGTLKQIWLVNAANEIAQLTITSSTYSSGPNTTTVVVANPSAFDLSMGLSAVDYPDKLRVAPFDITFKTRANTGETITAASYEDGSIFSPPTVKLTGESLTQAITDAGVNGSALLHAMDRSPNGQYYIAKFTEQAAGSVIFHWFYSIDRGKTWAKYSSTRNQGTSATQTDEMSYNKGVYNNPSTVIVANNGKWMSTYNSFDGSRTSTKGVYGDISVGVPTFSDTPGIANDAFNFNTSNSSVAGFIFSRSGAEESGPCALAGDKTDLSFVCAIGANDSFNILMIQQFTAGGATAGVRNSTSTNDSSWTPTMVRALVSGSSTTHRLGVFMRNTGGASIWKYYDQATSGAAITTTTTPSPLGSAAIIGGAINTSTHRAYGLHTGSAVTGYSSFTNASVPGFVARSLYFREIDYYNGGTQSTGEALMRNNMHRVVIDPSNDNHVFFSWEFLNAPGGSGARSAYMAEIYDNDFIGLVQSQATLDTAFPFRSTSATTQIGQTFTPATTTRVRSVVLFVQSIGTVAFGSTITATIQATTAGVPNGTVLATSLNSYDGRKFFKGGNTQEILFTFNNTALTGSTQYAIVLSSSFTINASNYIAIVGSGADTLAGGTRVVYNGTTWSTTTGDFGMYIYGEYLFDMSFDEIDANGAASWKNNDSLNAMEHQIELPSVGSSTFYSTYRLSSSIDQNRWPTSGNVRRTPVSISGSSTSASTIGTRVTAGYATGQYDENLVFAMAPGTDTCSRRVFTTGVVSSTEKSEDRGGLMVPTSSYGGAVTYTADSDFQTGFALSCDGSSASSFTYSSYQFLHFNQAGLTFAIEAEIKGPYGAATRTIANTYDGASGGWFFRLNAGFLEFAIVGQAARASDATESNSYHKVRFVWDGSVGRLYRTTGAPHTTFTEVAGYASQTLTGGVATNSTMTVGVDNAGGGSRFIGKIGYIKIAKGFTTAATAFSYDGFKDQSARAIHLNLGDTISAKNSIGQNSATTNVQYHRMNLMDPNASGISLKDAYASTFKLKRAMTAGKVPELKIEWTRAGNQDSSRIEGIIGEYSK